MNKLEGIPKIYYINLDDAVERNTYILEMFDKYGITNFERYEAKRESKSLHNKLNASQYGCAISHFNVIEKIANGNDDYAIVIEDDTDISVVDQWDFTWKDIVDNLPEFNVVQLVRCQITSQFQTGVQFKEHSITDWSAGAYLISKSYAIGLTKLYKRDRVGLSRFKYPSRNVGPVADYVIFAYSKSYSMCIFSMKWLGSQISANGILEKCCTDYVQSLFKNTIKLRDVFRSIK